MSIRKALLFKTILGLTLPNQYTQSLGVKHGEYFEVYLAAADTIVIKKHVLKLNKVRESDIKLAAYE